VQGEIEILQHIANRLFLLFQDGTLPEAKYFRSGRPTAP
jgi:hypothetical protein